MKTTFPTCLLILLMAAPVYAQTADELVSQGRGFLVQEDALNAKNRFEAALGLAPNHADANALLALVRLLSLGNTPEGTVLLDRLGLSPGGRNPFDWQSEFPTGLDGQSIMPTNFSASELSAFVRTNIVPALRASETNFSLITNPNYTLALSSAESHLENVVIDYGDIQLLRSLLHAGEYLALTIHSGNVDAQLAAFQSNLTNESNTIAQFLADHPQFLTFATTNDLGAARTAFQFAAQRYFVASDLIQARPPNTLRLFNFDLEQADAELTFRETLTDVTNSLTGPVVVVNDTNYTVHLARHFDGQTPWRTLLPFFHDNAFLVGTFPDASFGGLIQGISRVEVERILAEELDAVQPLTGNLLEAPRRFNIEFPTLTNHYYSLERTTNLVRWSSVAKFRGFGTNYSHADFTVAATEEAYYRLVDLSHYLSIEGRVLDSCSGLPISNASVSTTLDPSSTVTDAAGNFFLQTELIPGFFNINVIAFAPGYSIFQQSLWAGEDVTEIIVGLSPGSSSVPGNDNFANRIALVGSNPSGSGTVCGATREGGEPGTGNSVWWTWTATFTGQASIQVVPTGYSWPQVNVYTGSSLVSLVSRGNYSFTATAGQTYQLRFSATGQPMSFDFSLASQPVLTITTPLSGTTFTAPANIQFAATFTSPAASLRKCEFFSDDGLIGTITNPPIDFVWSNVPPGYYYVYALAEDSNGRVAYAPGRSFTVVPGNDDFVDRSVLSGANILVSGDNNLASAESGEPLHDGTPASQSVWWSWTASTSGPVTVEVFSDYADYESAISLGLYTGTAVSLLNPVADYTWPTPYGVQAGFTASAGTTYQIAVDGWTGGSFQLALASIAAPVVSIISPTNGQVFLPGEPIVLEAVATDVDGTIQNVSFMDELLVLGSDSSSPYQWTYPLSAPEGLYYVSATASDSQGLVGYSDYVYFEVVAPLPSSASPNQSPTLPAAQTAPSDNSRGGK